MEGATGHRPRNLDWARAAAFLYGGWGTSKAYVIGVVFSATFALSAYHSLPIIIAVSLLTALVAYNYVIICHHFPDGGGVYSSARTQSKFLAVAGALLLVADLTVTASLSAWSAMEYFRVPPAWIPICTIGVIVLFGLINIYGPKHSGSLAIWLSIPSVCAVVFIIALSAPRFDFSHLSWSHAPLSKQWLAFVGMVLALSGVEAIANLTGVMKLDRNSSLDAPKVGATVNRAIWPVAIEVVFGTILLGMAMLSLPKNLEPLLHARWKDMLSLLGEQYGAMTFGTTFGKFFGFSVGLMVGLLLLSAVNTAITALIGLIYTLGRDGEMPAAFIKLNRFGVPWLPLVIAVVLPSVVVMFSPDLESLMGLYAIGVIGAITVNVGSCTFNRALKLLWSERTVMGLTFFILLLVELTVAKTKPDALFFACCVLLAGFGLRGYAQRRAGLHTLTVGKELAAHLSRESHPEFRIRLNHGNSILVAARGLTPVLRFAFEEARLRGANLYVLFVKEIAVAPGSTAGPAAQARWQDDPEAALIMSAMIKLGEEHQVAVVPLYSISEQPAATILDLSATLGVDFLILGGSQRRRLVNLLKGNVVAAVAKDLPENIELVIHG
jgi:amino acid transporter/nucleotide-binding universal stress UspA family protein